MINRTVPLFLLCFLISCGGSDPSAPADEVTAEAWQLFGERLYEDAVVRFTDALDLDAEWSDAYNGRGWCYLELRRLEEAEDDLELAVSLSGGAVQVANEARTALGSVYYAGKYYSLSVPHLTNVIDLDPSFRFSHRVTVDIIDVRLILSNALIGMAEDESDPQVVDSLFDSVADQLNAIDPENPVTREDPSSWRIGDNRYSSFEETIMEKLEWLVTIYYG